MPLPSQIDCRVRFQVLFRRCFVTIPDAMPVVSVHLPPGTLFKSPVMRFMFLSALSLRHRIFRAVSFPLYRMSYALFGTCATDSPRMFVHRSFVVLRLDQRLGCWCSLDTCSRPTSRVLQPKHGNHVSDVLRIRFNRVTTSCCHDHSAQKQYLIVQLSQLSHKSHHGLKRPNAPLIVEFRRSDRTAVHHQHE